MCLVSDWFVLTMGIPFQGVFKLSTIKINNMVYQVFPSCCKGTVLVLSYPIVWQAGIIILSVTVSECISLELATLFSLIDVDGRRLHLCIQLQPL